MAGASDPLIIVGAGPSGLAAAHEATKLGLRPLVFEASDKLGGLARTESFEGNRYDIGPHRFFTLNKEVNDLFRTICGDDLIQVNRLTRIFYANKFINYPLTPVNALFGVGVLSGINFFASYITANILSRLFPKPIETFEDWVVDRFGRGLFEAFFKNYTEKVWGIPCTEISAEWAGQRIKGLSLIEAVRHAVLRPRGGAVRTLIDEFSYPRLGAGQFYEKLADAVISSGGEIRRETACNRLIWKGNKVLAVETRAFDGTLHRETGQFFLSSAPLTEIVRQFDPPAPETVQEAVRALRYRHHISVQLVLRGEAPFPDNWIYVHSPVVRVARVASYRNFSPAMTAAPDRHPVTAEYFCFEDDPVWVRTDADLLALAAHELSVMGLMRNCVGEGGYVVRSRGAYPVIERGHQQHIAVIKEWLDSFSNFLPIGRSGMFKYNNQDHAIYTGMLAARTAAGVGSFDPWLVNTDSTYHEGAKIE